MFVNANTYNDEKESHAEIITRRGTVILVDKRDLESLKPYSWHITSKGYASALIGKKLVYMHRFLMSPGKLQVDHINLNKLDNRRENLRIVTNQQNHFNMPLLKNNKSGKSGVHFNKTVNKWCCQITVNNRCVYSKLFVSKADAIEKRLELETKYHRINK